MVYQDMIEEQGMEHRQCKTRLCSAWYKHKHELYKWAGWNTDGKIKLRSWGDMTRDPYVAFYAACVFLGQEGLIPAITPPWYLRRPANFRRWLRAVQGYGGSWSPRKRPSKHEFVNRLTADKLYVYNELWLRGIIK
jgi:hypothetical protein